MNAWERCGVRALEWLGRGAVLLACACAWLLAALPTIRSDPSAPRARHARPLVIGAAAALALSLLLLRRRTGRIALFGILTGLLLAAWLSPDDVVRLLRAAGLDYPT